MRTLCVPLRSLHLCVGGSPEIHHPVVRWATVAAILLCAAPSLGATVYDDTFARGNLAYEQGDYQGAIDAYEQLIEESVVDVAVFFNLGNAYYRRGLLGPAIANYERALQLHPDLDYVRENLEKCVAETERRLGRPLPSDWEQSLLFWHYNLPQHVTRLLAVISWFLFWTLLGLRQLRPWKYLLRAALIVGALALLFGVSAWVKAHGDLYAVANERRVPVHYGKSDDETVRFELYEGDRVLVDQRDQGWLRVTTVDGEQGWARQGAFTFVGPPYDRPAPPSSEHTTQEPAP